MLRWNRQDPTASYITAVGVELLAAEELTNGFSAQRSYKTLWARSCKRYGLRMTRSTKLATEDRVVV
jgi:hypothetical protein